MKKKRSGLLYKVDLFSCSNAPIQNSPSFVCGFQRGLVEMDVRRHFKRPWLRLQCTFNINPSFFFKWKQRIFEARKGMVRKLPSKSFFWAVSMQREEEAFQQTAKMMEMS